MLGYRLSFYPCLNIAYPEDESEGNDSHIWNEEIDGFGWGFTISQKRWTARLTRNTATDSKIKPAKIRLSPEELLRHDTGVLLLYPTQIKIEEKNAQLQFLVDEMVVPSCSFEISQNTQSTFPRMGVCFIRELEFSKLSIRLIEKGAGKMVRSDKIVTKPLNTFDCLKQCLNNPTAERMQALPKVPCFTMSMKYMPVQMELDPSESINNMGNLRIDILDGSNLRYVDRNGYSDPFCVFELGGERVHRTKVHKKTLHPAWNEYFVVDIQSRTAAYLCVRVLDWNFASSPVFVGTANIPITELEPFRPKEVELPIDSEQASVRIRALFKPCHIPRSTRPPQAAGGTYTFTG